MIGFIAYAALVYLHWGLLYSGLTGKWTADHDQIRTNTAFSLLVALVPISWILGPFVTGFYQHGWLTPFKERKFA